ncbi:Splicing factor-like protein [Parasponia andersonii]|uniref:Splicing factor-like protein n=1 Tax=Parasponia andersonii TaxID=3476 RepID=A0A2P5AT17_PARAD|nr:Splicing factor-like protein [Parasponia andersonii]
MTIDEERSIYVGGLPYGASEDTIRQVFDVYGAVVDVKIVNDRKTRGKCYCFVTFTNPRSAIDAINDMDGRTIDGRVVRVNGVRTRGGRSAFGRENFHRDIESGRDWDQGRGRVRDREQDYDRDRERYHDRSSDRSREHDRSTDYDLERERGYEHAYDYDQARDDFLERDRDQDRYREDNDIKHSRNHDRDWERDRGFNLDGEKEMDRANGHDKFVEPENSRKGNGSSNADRYSREILTKFNDDYDDQLEEQVQRSRERLEELNKEILQMEERVEDKGKSVLDLQQKSKKLEEALINAKKTSSYRKMQLTKLHKSFLQVKDYTEKLKSSEKHLQFLVDEARSGDLSDDPLWSGILANGNA